jgi:AraC-like DNA-binding protein
LLLLVSLNCLNIYFFHAAWFQASVLLNALHALIPLVIVMPVGPLLFLYARQLAEPYRHFAVKDRWHFVLVVIDLVPYLAAIIYFIGNAIYVFKAGPRPWADFIDNYDAFADIPRWLSITIYLGLAWQVLYLTKSRSRPQLWLKALLIGFSIFQFIWLLYQVPYLLPAYNIRLLKTVGWYPVMVPLVGLVYWAGIKAYLYHRTSPELLKPRVLLAEATFNQTLIMLELAMQTDQLYLDPRLQLENVSARTGLPAKTISATLNQHLGQSFNQWVNCYRVEAFKQKLTKKDQRHLTLAGIAKECGFNSPTTFQRIFKQLTGMVPTEYLDQLSAKKEQPNPDLGVAEF